MATEIIGYGFVPGLPTKKDVEPKVQPTQQKNNSELIMFMLVAAIVILAAVVFVQCWRQLPVA